MIFKFYLGYFSFISSSISEISKPVFGLKFLGSAGGSYEFSCLPVRPSVFITVFSGLAHNVFAILCMKLGFKKHIKVTESIYLPQFLLCLRRGKWDIFIPKINIFELSPKSFLWIFLKSYLTVGINEWVKETV